MELEKFKKYVFNAYEKKVKDVMLEYLENHWIPGRDHDLIKDFINNFFKHVKDENEN